MAQADPKVINQNINLLDPPKDMVADESHLNEGAHGDYIKPLLTQLFWPQGGALPNGYRTIGDTKTAIKNALGTFKSHIDNEANRLRILRGNSSAGYDSRPSDLYVSQDSGPKPKSIIKNPKIIISGGTIMDPASKTKIAATVLTDETYRKLPHSYIKKLGLENVITGDVELEVKETHYELKIPIKLVSPGATARDSPVETTETIIGKLSKDTFKPIGDDITNPGSVYFKGNNTKNNYIYSNFATTDQSKKNEIKKYLLVKELGDTLQVIWLRYIIENSEDNPTPPGGKKYREDNTVLVTADTVVWYRCIVNKVPVIVTYLKDTNLYKVGDEAVFIAAFKKTIRDEAIARNESVIKTIREVMGSQRRAEKRWLTNYVWDDGPYNVAVGYLTSIVPKLENLNKDADIFFEKVTSIDAAKSAAARYNFQNPFTLHKDGYWKTNDKVTQIYPGIPFKAASFKPSTIALSLAQAAEFKQGGGGQRGGARKTKEEKIAQIEAIGRLAKAAIPAAVDAYFAERVREWNQGGTVSQTLDAKTRARIGNPSQIIRGDSNNFMNEETNESWLFWSNNLVNTETVLDKIKRPHFLYLFVRDYFQEIFPFAAMVKQALDANVQEKQKAVNNARPPTRSLEDALATATTLRDRFKLVDIDLAGRYKMDYTENYFGQFMPFMVEGGPVSPETTLNATLQAISLARKLTDMFPALRTQELEDFFAYFDHPTRFRPALPTLDIVFTQAQLNAMAVNIQGGGGKPPMTPVEAILNEAMDTYEIYYGLAVRAAYEDRDVTKEEFVKALKQAEQEVTANTVRTTPLKSNRSYGYTSKGSQGQMDFFKLANLMKGSRFTGMTAQERDSISSFPSSSGSSNYLSVGGKKKNRKTQKKRKASRKQRKTRRHKK
jgi:hypothetical protein